MTKSERAEMYRDYLNSEGFPASIDDDGDIVFKSEGRTYLILIYEKDDTYFQLVYPSFWSIESDQECEQAAAAALYATSQTKAAKVYLTKEKDNTWASVECFFSAPEHFKGVFTRMLLALQAGVKSFTGKMQE